LQNLKLTANDIRAEGNLISPQAISCYCTMKTDLKAELERLSLAKLIAEFTRELSLQYLIPVDLSDGGKDYTRSLIVPSGYRNLGVERFRSLVS